MKTLVKLALRNRGAAIPAFQALIGAFDNGTPAGLFTLTLLFQIFPPYTALLT